MLTEVQVTGVESAQKAAISLLSRDGPGAVVVTLGAQGVVYTERGKPGTHHVAAETVKAVDTTVSTHAHHVHVTRGETTHPNSLSTDYRLVID